jgi:hypothetical protein
MNSSAHAYEIGDTVLARMGSAQVPGVIDSINGLQLQVRLAQPWVDAEGTERSIVVLAAGDVVPVLDGNAPRELPEHTP